MLASNNYNESSQQSPDVLGNQIRVKEEVNAEQRVECNHDQGSSMNPGASSVSCEFRQDVSQLLLSHVQHVHGNPVIKTEPDFYSKTTLPVSSHMHSLSGGGMDDTVLNIYTDPALNDKKRIACEFCGMKYKTQENLQKHMEKTGCSTQERIDFIQCSTCGLSFPARSNLTRHQKRTGCVQKESDISDEETNIEQYPALKPEALAQRLPNLFYCDTCGLSYKSRSNLVRHQKKSGCRQAKLGTVRDNLNDEILLRSSSLDMNCELKESAVSVAAEYSNKKPMEWDQQEEVPQYASDFLIPSQTTVSSKNTDSQVPHQQNHLSDVPNSRFEITCDLCNRSFENVKRLYNHADIHDRIPLVLIGDLEFLKCKFCLKQFTDHIERKTHEATHTGDKPYECPHCQQKFVRNRNLLQHIRIHSSELPFKCDNCSQSFRDRRYLTRHIERNHLKVERLACTLCDTKVYDKVQLALHMRTHIDGHTFVCKNCGKTKQSMSNQDQIEGKPEEPESDGSDEQSHQESNVPNNPDLFCDLCNRYFSDKEAFYHHAESHETVPTALKDDINFRKCKFCYKEFTTHIERKSHERTHKRKRPYECPICKKRFICDLSRNIHVRTHSGPVTFECEKCSTSFKEKSGLKRHIRRKHLNIRKVICDLCDQRFFDRVALAIHMLSHIKEGNYVCKTCKNCTQKKDNKVAL